MNELTFAIVLFSSVQILLLIGVIFINLTGRSKPNGTKEVIDLAKENAELKRGVNDIFLILHKAKKGIKVDSMRHDDVTVRYIINEILDNIEVINEHWKK